MTLSLQDMVHEEANAKNSLEIQVRCTFKKFVIFLERCKVFEEDAKRFVIMTGDTANVQVDYGVLRPLFLRAIKHKTGNDVLKLFEQFRKNLKLNKSFNHL